MATDAKPQLPKTIVAFAKMDKLTKGGYARFNAKKGESGNQLVGQVYPEAKAEWALVKKVRIEVTPVE